MMRDENRVKKCEKYLILLNKLAGVVQWQNGSFPTFSANFHYNARSASLVLATPKSRLCWSDCAKFARKINQRREKKSGPGQTRGPLGRVIRDGGPDQTQAEPNRALLRARDRGIYPQDGWLKDPAIPRRASAGQGYDRRRAATGSNRLERDRRYSGPDRSPACSSAFVRRRATPCS